MGLNIIRMLTKVSNDNKTFRGVGATEAIKRMGKVTIKRER